MAGQAGADGLVPAMCQELVFVIHVYDLYIRLADKQARENKAPCSMPRLN